MTDIDQAYQQKLIDRRMPLSITITGHQDSKPKEGDGESEQGVGKGESAGPDAPQMTEQMWRTDPQIQSDLATAYTAFTGKPAPDAEMLAQWGIEKISNFNLAMGDATDPFGKNGGGGMIAQATQVLNKFTPDQAGAFARLLEAHDQLPTFTLPGFGRFVRNIATDPTSLVGIATLGAGMAGRQAAKEGVKQALRQRIGQAIVANPLKVGAAEAATYAGAGDAVTQNVKVKGGTQDEYSALQTAGAVGAGGALGAGMMAAAPYVGKAVKKGMENLAAPRAPKVGPGAQRGAVGDLSKGGYGKTGIDTPEFKNWFGDSKVVDAEGKPLVVYHGTARSFDKFDPKMRGGFGGQVGFWFASDPAATDSFSRIQREITSGPNIVPVYLSVNKPMEYASWQEHVDAVMAIKGENLEQKYKSLRASLSRKGFDGIVIRNSDTDGGVVRDDWVAFSPTQIKSAIGNRGTFDPNDANILRGIGVASASVAAATQSDDAEALPLSRPIAQAIRRVLESSENVTVAGVKKAITDTGIKQDKRKIDATAKRVIEINKQLSGAKPDTTLWSGSIGTMRVGHPEMGGYHVMLEHPGDLVRILRAGGVDVKAAESMPLRERLTKSLDIIDSNVTKENADHVKVGDLRIRIVRDGKYIGTFYPE